MAARDFQLRRLRQSQKRVRALLKQGKYDDISLTSYGRLGHFFDFIFRIGLLKIVSRLPIYKHPQGIPVALLALLWVSKALLGFKYVDNLRYMMRDKHLMRLCGFRPEEIEHGYSRRTTYRGSKPIHPDSVRNFGISLSPEISERLHREIVSLVHKRGQIKGGVFALDAKFIGVEGKQFENAKLGIDHLTDRYKLGYKLFLLQNVQQGHQYIVCAALRPGNQNERAMLLPMVEKALAVLGKDAIKALLIDRGYLSGRNLYLLKHKYGIDFIIPGMANMDVVNDAIALSKGYPRHAFRNVSDGVELAACSEMGSWDSYMAEPAVKTAKWHKFHRPSTINVLLIKDKAANPKPDSNTIWSYLTSLPMQTGDDAEKLYALYNLYRDRWVIENNAFKELTSFWNLTKMPGGKFNTICCHLFFTLAVYNLVLLFKSKEAVKLLGHSVMTVREVFCSSEALAVVYVGSMFGVFAAAEVVEALGRSPP